MTANYRLDTVTIEGFKGFTTPQTITFSGKSTFIFGQNGWGKSSILEAISWCLWGRDKEDEKLEIRNTDYYTGDCRVELVLIRGTEHIRVTRRLSAATGESDPWVTRNGKRQNITEVLPQIRKLGGKGARVLFSQQGVSLRWAGDLDRFKDVIDAYLKLDRLEKMKTILKEVSQKAKEEYDKELKKGWKDIEGGINDLSHRVAFKVDQLLKEPPWDDASPPTRSQVIERIKALYGDLCKFGGAQPDNGVLSADTQLIIIEIEKLIQVYAASSTSTTILEERKQFLITLQDLRNKWTKLNEECTIFKTDLGEAETSYVNAGGSEEINRLKANQVKLAEEEKVLSQELGMAVAKYEEAKRKQIIEQPRLEIKVNQIKLTIEKIETLEKNIYEAKSALQSSAGNVDLTQLGSELTSKKLILGQQQAYASLLSVIDDYCSRYNCDSCPICGVKLDSNSKIHSVEEEAARQHNEALDQVKILEDRIEKIQQIKTRLENLNLEIQKLLEGDPDPNSNLKLTLDTINELAKDVQLTEGIKIQIEQKYTVSRLKILMLIAKTKESLARLNSLEMRCSEIRQNIETNAVELTSVKANVAKQLGLNVNQTELHLLQAAIDLVSTELAQIVNDLDKRGAIVKTYKDRLTHLRNALKFHDLLKLQSELTDLKTGKAWTNVEKSLLKYSTFLSNIAKIIESLDLAYAKAFGNNVQDVNCAVQIVYKKLTAQQSYPDARVRIDQASDNSNEIIMEVGIAARDIWRQNDVLNEQSRHAIALVPYFAFSELGMLKHDLDFLLIDDPSQSFDTQHLDELVSMLHSAANYAQIVLATHEIEKFDPRIRSKFGQDACLLRVSGFDPNSGPTVIGI